MGEEVQLQIRRGSAGSERGGTRMLFVVNCVVIVVAVVGGVLGSDSSDFIEDGFGDAKGGERGFGKGERGLNGIGELMGDEDDVDGEVL